MKLADIGQGDFECPHCKAQYEDTLVDSYMPSTWSGELSVDCLSCGQYFLLKWGADLEVAFETSVDLIQLPEPRKPLDTSRVQLMLIRGGRKDRHHRAGRGGKGDHAGRGASVCGGDCDRDGSR